MIPIPATNVKLAEAAFFHRKLLDVGRRRFSPEPEAFGYYLSAFVSAARSVTFALQSERKAEYDAWFPGWKSTLDADKRALLEDFNEHRVAAVHQGGVEVTHRTEEISPSEFYFAASTEGVQVHIWNGPPGTPRPPFQRTVRTLLIGGTQIEVMEAATQYLELLVGLVSAFQSRHGEATA